MCHLSVGYHALFLLAQHAFCGFLVHRLSESQVINRAFFACLGTWPMALELGIFRRFAENWELSTKHIMHKMLKYVFNKLILLYSKPFPRLLYFKFHLYNYSFI